MKTLQQAARRTVREVLKLKPNERMLVISCPVKSREEIARAIYEEARQVSKKVLYVLQEPRISGDYRDELLNTLIKAEPEVIYAASYDVLGRDPEGLVKPYHLGRQTFTDILKYLEAKKKIRGAYLGGHFDGKMFTRLTMIDLLAIRKDGVQLQGYLNAAHTMVIKTPYGTELNIPIRGRRAINGSLGRFDRPGNFGNWPSGEVFVSPEVGKTEGTYAIDGSINIPGKVLAPKKPIILFLRNGFIYDIAGGTEARELKTVLRKAVRQIRHLQKDGNLSPTLARVYARNIYGIGEAAMGINPAATVRGRSSLEDEITYGTAHIAIGANYNHDQPTLIHFDAVTRCPEITAYLPGNQKKVLVANHQVLP